MSTTSPQAPLEMRQRVMQVLAKIAPYVESDGGAVELVSVSPAGRVEIRFHGECIGCPSSDLTLQHTIEANLKRAVPEVTEVVAVA